MGETLVISYDDSIVSDIVFSTVLSGVPTGLTATPVVGGGTFAAGTCYYEVTATTALGETTVSAEASAVVALNGSVNLAWTPPNNVVTHYKIYRGTASGAENVLVATVAPGVTAFTDTNVGGAGAPPVANTATIQDYTLITGACWFAGFSLNEPTGAATASVDIQDNGGTIAKCNLAAGDSKTSGPFTKAVPINAFIRMHVTSGQFGGVVYVRIPSVC
jgi:hypothetical protein